MVYIIARIDLQLALVALTVMPVLFGLADFYRRLQCSLVIHHVRRDGGSGGHGLDDARDAGSLQGMRQCCTPITRQVLSRDHCVSRERN